MAWTSCSFWSSAFASWFAFTAAARAPAAFCLSPTSTAFASFSRAWVAAAVRCVCFASAAIAPLDCVSLLRRPSFARKLDAFAFEDPAEKNKVVPTSVPPVRLSCAASRPARRDAALARFSSAATSALTVARRSFAASTWSRAAWYSTPRCCATCSVRCTTAWLAASSPSIRFTSAALADALWRAFCTSLHEG